jgi:hypothetical protein
MSKYSRNRRGQNQCGAGRHKMPPVGAVLARAFALGDLRPLESVEELCGRTVPALRDRTHWVLIANSAQWCDVLREVVYALVVPLGPEGPAREPVEVCDLDFLNTATHRRGSYSVLIVPKSRMPMSALNELLSFVAGPGCRVEGEQDCVAFGSTDPQTLTEFLTTLKEGPVGVTPGAN